MRQWHKTRKPNIFWYKTKKGSALLSGGNTVTMENGPILIDRGSQIKLKQKPF